MNGFEECLAGLLELVRRLVVADLVSELVEYFKAETRLQIILGVEE